VNEEAEITNSNLILDILGNETRRKILFVLSQEPMYFNQLAREIGIGQQAILRHMEALENGGLIKTYAEKSDLGAPNRKYYRLNSSFSLTIALSQDSFSIENRIIMGSGNKKPDAKFDKNKPESISSATDAKNTTGQGLIHLQTDLTNIENQISNLELRLNELRSLKQLALRRIHEIGKNNFEHLERKVLNTTIAVAAASSPKSISKIAAILDENESNVRRAVAGICDKLDTVSAKKLFGELK
jgi:ArsR family transcriptional regulator